MPKIDFQGWEPPHVSHSTISGYRMCGSKTLFQKVLRLEEKPGLAAIGGNAVHTATEQYDLGLWTPSVVDNGDTAEDDSVKKTSEGKTA